MPSPSLLFRPHLPTSKFLSRLLSTLPSNPHIYIHPSPSSTPTLTESYTLTLTPTTPPHTSTAIGTSATNPPHPSTFRPNPSFTTLLQSTLAQHAHRDPSIKAQAVAFAAAATAGSGGLAMAKAAAGGVRSSRKGKGMSEARADVKTDVNAVVGFMHVADDRNPAAYGRIPEPEDIFGSLEVMADGRFAGSESDGVYQESGTYRLLTHEGCLGLTPYLRERLVERIREIEDGEGH